MSTLAPEPSSQAGIRHAETASGRRGAAPAPSARSMPTLLPRVRDTQVQANLAAALEAHRKNIERVEARTSVGQGAGWD